ncbi:hypothetical protein [Ruminobacter sp. RM87]|uniref:hypothetical protein n=1 Tax=Ruminobacter sp. RM87 TaxID=1200567 RepID=UPI0004E156F0|nr:hypothetical protein [Ruminobacter sp. RM87]
MISLYKKFTVIAAASLLTACSNLSEYQTKLPHLEYKEVTADISNKTAPVVNANFCIVNNLDRGVDVERLMLILFVNGMEIDMKEIDYDKEVKANSRKCHTAKFEPDVVHSPNASSTLLNTMLDRTYRIEGTVVYDDDDVIPVTTSGEGILY